MPKVILNRKQYAKDLFLRLCDDHGIRPNGWGSLDDLLQPQRAVGFQRVLWNHRTRRFFVQPRLHTWRCLVDPSGLFTDKLECETCALEEMGWVLDDSFTDDGAALMPFWAFLTPGYTYDLLSPEKYVM